MPPKKRGRPSSTSKPSEAAATPPKSNATKRTSASASASKPSSTSKPTYTSKSAVSSRKTPSKSTPPPKQQQDSTPQIRAAFDSYTTEGPDRAPIITVPDVSRALRALQYPLPPKDFFDKEQEEEGVSWEEFRELAGALGEGVEGAGEGDDEDDEYEDGNAGVEDEDDDGDGDDEADDEIDEEVKEAFALFTQYQPKGPAGNTLRERRITVQDLQRIARELKEDVSEETLRLMVEEANGEVGQGGVTKGVGVKEFEGVMRRSGVIK